MALGIESHALVYLFRLLTRRRSAFTETPPDFFKTDLLCIFCLVAATLLQLVVEYSFYINDDVMNFDYERSLNHWPKVPIQRLYQILDYHVGSKLLLNERH